MTSALEGDLRYADIMLTPAAGGNFLVVFICILGEARGSEQDWNIRWPKSARLKNEDFGFLLKNVKIFGDLRTSWHSSN